MEFWIYFWIYTLSMIMIWGFFIIAKIHSLKFKNYQPKIIDLTRLATYTLSVLTIIGFILIFFFSGNGNIEDVRDNIPKIKNISEFSDISEKDSIIPESAGEEYY